MLLMGCTHEEQSRSIMIEQTPHGLNASILEKDGELVLSVYNGLNHAIAFPIRLEASRSVFFDELTPNGIQESHAAIISTPPSANRLALVKMGAGTTIRSTFPIAQVTKTELSKIKEMRARIVILPQENKVEGTRAWSGTIITAWCPVRALK